MARISKRWWAVVAVAAAVLAAAIALWPRTGSDHRDKPVSTAHLTGTSDYLPGVAADLYLPSTPASARKPIAAPVVVLVPGGGWQTADRLGLNEVGRVSLRLTQPLFFDPYNRNRQTGGLILIDEATNATVGAVMITEGR